MRNLLHGILVSTLAAVGGANAQPLPSRVLDVAWPPIGASTLPPDISPSAKVLQEANKAYLPVLIPRFMLSLKTFKLVADDYSYVGSADLIGASISITATRIGFGPDAPANVPIEEIISVDEKSVDLTRVTYGVSYTLRIECANLKDERCADKAYLQGRAQVMDLIGGNQAAPPPRATTAAEENSPMPAGATDTSFATPAGKLNPDRSGMGVSDPTIYAPGIRFPLESRPAYLNSQVYGYGGYLGPKPSTSAEDTRYKYPWYDNFCEKRSRVTRMCPSGQGHQGVDIRAANGMKRKYKVVAVESGKITRIGTYSVSLTGVSGTEYRYLHLWMADVKRRVFLGKPVSRGEVIGLVSNDFGKVPTTVHLHFEVWKNLNGRGSLPVPPYSSLVKAYAELP